MEANADDLAPGEELGDFRVVRELGRGGMATVYEAEQRSLGRRVALKVLPAAFRRQPQLRARFEREARAAAKLRHPGIVPVFAVGEERGVPFIAMELVDGRPLSTVIDDLRAGRATSAPSSREARVSWAVELVAKVAEALGYAHEQGILHRDVKPGNILLDRDGAPRLSDFGLALDVGAQGLTAPGDSLGSPQYMSPEQAFARGRTIDQRTDTYSLGVTLYELITLEFPYPSRDIKEILGALSTGEIVPPSERDTAIAPSLDAAILRALESDPERRPRDMREFASELRATLARPQATRRRAPRRVLAMTLVALLAIAITIAGVSKLSWPFSRDNEHRTPTSEEVDALADGRVPNAEAILLAWIQPKVELRRVLARDQLGKYRCALDVPLPDGLAGDLWFEVHWEVSVDSGPWKPAAQYAPTTSRYPLRGQGSTSIQIDPELSEVLAGVAATPTLTLQHRATFSIGRGALEDSSTRPGSTATWEDVRTVFVYDRYPDDYPEQVRGDDIDRAMVIAMTPESIVYQGASSPGGGTKTVQLQINFPNRGGALPIAGLIEFSEPDQSTPFARGDISDDLGAARGRLVSMSGHYNLEPLAPEREAQLMLALESGKLDRVHFVFRSSRDVALSRTRFDRMWSGSVDVVVPLERKR